MKIFLTLSLLFIGQYVSIAQSSGTVVEWGHNPSVVGSQISNSLARISDQILTNATAIAIGVAHYLALKDDGTVAGWGWNNFGQATGVSSGPNSGLVTINGQALSNVTAIAAGTTQSIGLKSDGTVVTWGANNAGHKIDVPSGLTNAVAVAAGWDHCLVLKKDGTLISLAAGGSSVLDVSNVVDMVAGQGYGFGAYADELALKNDGSVVGWNRSVLDNSLPKGPTNITSTAASGGHYLALTKDGTVFGWGVNDRGQATGVPTTNYLAIGFVSINGQTLNDVTAIAAGGDCSLALKKDGTVVAWGRLGIQPATVPAGLSNVVVVIV